MLVGSIVDNDQQAGSFGIFAALGVAAIGGCMVPLEFFPDTMQTVAHFTPHAWGLDGFAELVRRDRTIADILPELAVLALFAAGLLGLALWQLRRTLTHRPCRMITSLPFPAPPRTAPSLRCEGDQELRGRGRAAPLRR